MRPVIFLIIIILGCSKSPIEDGSKNDKVKMLLFYEEAIGQESAKITWSCSEDTTGILGYGENSIDKFLTSLYPSRNHSMTIQGLSPNKRYMYVAFCGDIGAANSGTRAIVTASANDGDQVATDSTKGAAFLAIKKRGIWIIGGIGTTNNLPESTVDLYDPVENKWYQSVTTLPTPRAFSTVVSYKDKIYVIGGLEVSGTTLVSSNKTEVYNIATDSWTTLNTVPRKITGAVGGVSGSEIYIIAGTTSTDMVNDTILNKVYKFSPEIGTLGTWTELTSQETIQPHIDMGGCVINGALFFTGGRYYSSGQERATTDVYITGSNSTTSTVEANLNQARHGVGYACYNPLPTDPFPSDSPALLIAGGSTLSNTAQPASAITASNRLDYYKANDSTSSFQNGPQLPFSLYYPAMGISYQNRTLYLFGGATTVNSATNLLLSLSLENPTSGSWQNLNNPMPKARYGHSAVVVNR